MLACHTWVWVASINRRRRIWNKSNLFSVLTSFCFKIVSPSCNVAGIVRFEHTPRAYERAVEVLSIYFIQLKCFLARISRLFLCISCKSFRYSLFLVGSDFESTCEVAISKLLFASGFDWNSKWSKYVKMSSRHDFGLLSPLFLTLIFSWHSSFSVDEKDDPNRILKSTSPGICYVRL